MYIKKKIRERALKARSPALVNGKPRAGDFRGGREIEYACAFAHFPVRLGSEIEFRGCAPSANFDILCRAVPNGHAGLRQIRNPEQKVFLSLCQSDGLEALDLDRLREGLHLSDERIGIPGFFLEPANLVAGFVPLRADYRDGGAQVATERSQRRDWAAQERKPEVLHLSDKR